VAPQRYDAIVVGAGPAGSAAAYHLAAAGRQVLLLEVARMPRDKSCGDVLTARAVRLLAEMGVTAALPRTLPIRGARVHMRGHAPREFAYATADGDQRSGLVVPRRVLDAALCDRAVAAGARLWQEARVVAPVMEHGRVAGVRVRRRGQVTVVRAPVVVAADGARSRLARAAGLLPPDDTDLGVAVRGYLSGVDGLSDRQEIFLPLVDVTARQLLPSYGWIHPTGRDGANVGVGVFAPRSAAFARELLRTFLARLRTEHPGFAAGRRRGGWAAAPLRFDFAPHRCAGEGILLVGDAAGLVSPFTGEGISYALESGRTAAEVIDRSLAPGRSGVDLLDYPMLLEHMYSGYFETGRRAAHRYQMVWRVLESTFDSERPPFAQSRRAVLLPEGVGEIKASRHARDVQGLIAPGLNVRDDLLGVGEAMTAAVRHEWPFLARLALSSWGDPGVACRPALFLLLASYFGDPRTRCLVDVAAAVELGCLAALAQRGVVDAPTGPPPPAGPAASADSPPSAGPADRAPVADPAAPGNWGNKFAILVGDLLLAKAMQLAVAGGPATLRLMSDAITVGCAGKLREDAHAGDLALIDDAHVEIIRMKAATLFELPCRLGGLLAGADERHVAALTRYAGDLAVAFQLTDDLHDLTADGPGSVAAEGLREGILPHPVLVSVRRDPNGPLSRLLRHRPMTGEQVADALALLRADGALAATRRLAAQAAERAARALAPLPAGPARTSLLRLTEYATARTAPRRPPLASAFDPVPGAAP
jgi:geranylgeranyl reductase family protein